MKATAEVLFGCLAILLLVAGSIGCTDNGTIGGGGTSNGDGGGSSPFGAFGSKQANIKTHELGEACYEPYEETCTADRSRVVKCEKAAGGGYAWTSNDVCSGQEICVVKFGNDGGYYRISCEYTKSFCSPSSGSCNKCVLDEEYGVYKCQDLPDVHYAYDACNPNCDSFSQEKDRAYCCQCCVKSGVVCSGCDGDFGDGGITDTSDSSRDDGVSDAGGVGETWYDSTSNLIWQVNPAANTMNWADAKTYCTGLRGGWHLPTISELRSLIRGCAMTQTGGACGVSDSCLNYGSCGRTADCEGCSADAGSGNVCYWPKEIEGTCSWFWSSSPVENAAGGAWGVNFGPGRVKFGADLSDGYVRCVRSGP